MILLLPFRLGRRVGLGEDLHDENVNLYEFTTISRPVNRNYGASDLATMAEAVQICMYYGGRPYILNLKSSSPVRLPERSILLKRPLRPAANGNLS